MQFRVKFRKKRCQLNQVLTILLLLVFGPLQSMAGFDFNPIIANLAPSGSGATASFTVTNLDTTKLAVQITMVLRKPDENGKEDFTEKESDKIEENFRIFPNQLILDPKGSRTVRVTYIGEPNIKSEIAYRIIAEELPVDLDDPNRKYTKPVAKISISTRYIGSLYVTPKTAKSDIVIEGKKSETASNQLEIHVTNKGTAHQIYRNPVVKVVSISNGKEVVVPDPDTKELKSQNVLAGMKRVFRVPWPKELAAGSVKVILDSTKE